MSADEFIEVYHGTAASHVDSIRETGLFPRTSPRNPEHHSMLTTNRELAEGFARREPLGDRAVIKYRVPLCKVDTYLHEPKNADRNEYPLKDRLPGYMIVDVNTEIPDPPTFPPSS